MTNALRLVTRSEIEQLLQHPIVRESDGLAVCSVVDLIQLCELYKKGKIRVSQASRDSMAGALLDVLRRNDRWLIVLDLDREQLTSALFEREDYRIIGLWPPVTNCGHLTSPAHSMRLLTVRSSDSTWWDSDILTEVEAIYDLED